MKIEDVVQLIEETNVEQRGNILLEIGEGLRKKGLNYTGALFIKIALEYGIKES